jgi:hypothetical protein
VPPSRLKNRTRKTICFMVAFISSIHLCSSVIICG